MRFSLKHLKTNEYTHDDEEVPEGAEFGFWRIVEHTGAGWFPWPELYATEAAATDALDRWLASKEGEAK